jgi:hypothetical protein
MTPEQARAVIEAMQIPDAQRCTVVTNGVRCVNRRVSGSQMCQGHVMAALPEGCKAKNLHTGYFVGADGLEYKMQSGIIDQADALTDNPEPEAPPIPVTRKRGRKRHRRPAITTNTNEKEQP